MRVLILRDDRPGHFNQSEGLALALARRRTVAVERLSLKTRVPFKGHALRWLAETPLSPAIVLRLAHGIRLTDHARPDLIISAGSETLVANLLMARAWGCANVFIGSLRGIPPERFTAVMTIYPRLADGGRVVLAAKPTTVDPDRLPSPRPMGAGVADGRSADPAGSSRPLLAGRSVAVLVGGPTPAHLWSGDDWRGLADIVAGLARRHGAEVVVTTSPRTPSDAVALLATLADEPGVTVSLYGTADALPRDHFFSTDAIIVTGDSATMAFEAVSARRPVVLLDPAARRPARDDEAFAWLAAEGRIARVDLPATAETVAVALLSARPLDAHPMDLVLDSIAPQLLAGGINVTAGEP